jgi:DNA-binding transcriptional MerR regulator
MISGLAARFGLSRSTLLYYDREGLLRPSYRSAAGYRLYGPGDVARLDRICRYRSVGLPLSLIRGLLDAPDSELTDALAVRLAELDEELGRARAQQKSILTYLYGDRRPGRPPVLTVERFGEMLDLAGVSADQRRRLHRIFERAAAEEHRAFLTFLGVPGGSLESVRHLLTPGEPDGAPGGLDTPNVSP